MLLDHRAIGGTQAREASKAQFECDVGGNLFALRLQSRNACSPALIRFSTCCLLSKRTPPARQERCAVQQHPIDDARQDELPVLGAEVREGAPEAEIVSGQISSFPPFGAQLRELGRHGNDGCVGNVGSVFASGLSSCVCSDGRLIAGTHVKRASCRGTVGGAAVSAGALDKRHKSNAGR
ncbi:hypothetical protein ASF41_22920 [Methylobacterium sp. Leaf111]|nr:hypothetical protein ASF41_22920 [Methylobacterium sp. Leaf111]